MTDTIALSSIKPNPDNPRTIRDTQFHALVESIKRDPQFLDKRGIVHADGVILGGNMRYRAIQEALKDAEFRAAIGVASAKEVPAAWVLDASEWTEQQRRRFVIVDNAPPGIAGDWDIDALANAWDDMPLAEWGLAPEVVEETDKTPGDKPLLENMYRVIIDCQTEGEMEALLAEFTERNLKCQSLIY